MSVSVKVEGLKELDEAIGELTKATARNVLRRALVKSAEPMRDKAKQLAPKDEGWLERSIQIGTKISNKVGKAEFAAVMQSGGSKAQAVSALRDARRAATGGSFAEAFVGVANVSKRNSIKANVQEFGSVKQGPQPYMRPAFETTRQAVVDKVAGELRKEVDKAAKRAARRAAKLAAKG